MCYNAVDMSVHPPEQLRRGMPVSSEVEAHFLGALARDRKLQADRRLHDILSTATSEAPRQNRIHESLGRRAVEGIKNTAQKLWRPLGKLATLFSNANRATEQPAPSAEATSLRAAWLKAEDSERPAPAIGIARVLPAMTRLAIVEYPIDLRAVRQRAAAAAFVAADQPYLAPFDRVAAEYIQPGGLLPIVDAALATAYYGPTWSDAFSQPRQ